MTVLFLVNTATGESLTSWRGEGELPSKTPDGYEWRDESVVPKPIQWEIPQEDPEEVERRTDEEMAKAAISKLQAGSATNLQVQKILAAVIKRIM